MACSPPPPPPPNWGPWGAKGGDGPAKGGDGPEKKQWNVGFKCGYLWCMFVVFGMQKLIMYLNQCVVTAIS